MEYLLIAVLGVTAFYLKVSLSDKEQELNSYKRSFKDLQDIKNLCAQKVEETKQYIKSGQDIYNEQVRNAREVENKKIFIESFLSSKIKDFPIVASPLADYSTARDEASINYLENKTRSAPKAADEIRKIKLEKKKLIEENKAYKWEIEYLHKLLPWLEELEELPIEPHIDVYNSNNQYDDAAGYWLTPQEYARLSNVEKYQLALDRYKKRKKTKAEIGREYERYIGYLYELAGYEVEYFGIEKGLEDLGRDLICKKDNEIHIVQCKCWSNKQGKQIREKYITQHLGTTLEYFLEQNIDKNITSIDFFNQRSFSDTLIIPIFYATVPLSDTAQRFADRLGVKFNHISLDDYPMIKCNINRTTKERIYHLPFDQQYDKCIIRDEGEFYAETVAEAEKAGFRRAMRWHGNNNFIDGYVSD